MAFFALFRLYQWASQVYQPVRANPTPKGPVHAAKLYQDTHP
jgi:hypothetical protein